MATFAFQAVDPRGSRSTGEIDAPDEGAATEILRQRGLIPVGMSTKRAGWNLEIRVFERVKPRDLVIFTRQLATMIDSGMPVLRALAVLEQQTEVRKLGEAISDVRKDIERGRNFSDALAEHPRIFNHLTVSMVRAGELGGILDQTLFRVADQMEKDDQLRRQVKSAMTYPAVVLSFAMIVLLVLVGFVVPTFVGVLKDFGGELPAITKVTVGISKAVTGYWWALLLGAVLLVVGVRRALRTTRGREFFHRASLKAPVGIGGIVQKVAVARWSRTLSALVGAGVPLLSAIEVTGKVAGNVVVERAMDDVLASVKRGGTISAPLRSAPIFPPMVCHMVGVGEETGALDNMLGKVADFYEDEVEVAVKSLTSILEPVMIVVIGAIVGFIVISMYLPLFAVYDSIG